MPVHFFKGMLNEQLGLELEINHQPERDLLHWMFHWNLICMKWRKSKRISGTKQEVHLSQDVGTLHTILA